MGSDGVNSAKPCLPTGKNLTLIFCKIASSDDHRTRNDTIKPPQWRGGLTILLNNPIAENNMLIATNKEINGSATE